MRTGSRNTLKASATAILGLIWTTALAGKDPLPIPPIKAPPGSVVYLGPWLEERLQEMVQSCSPSNSRLKMTRAKKDEEFDVSAVTPPMRNAFGLASNSLGGRIRPYEGSSMLYYFANVYRTADIGVLQPADGKHYLDIVREDAPEFVKAPRVDDATLIQTCATAMSGAISANAGFSIPILSVKGAFDADYDKSTAFSLNLVKSTFRSPLWIAYTGEKSPTQSPFHAAMTVLQWYDSHRDRIKSNDNWLLVDFQGVGVTQIIGLKRNMTVSGSASYSLGIPIFSGSDGSVAANTSWLTSLYAKKHWVAVTEDGAGKSIVTMQPLPTLKDAIAKAIATASVTIDRQQSGNDFTLYNRLPREIIYVIDRLPPSMCDARWRAVQSSPAATIGGVKAGIPTIVPSKDGWRSCHVPVTFTPSPKMPLTSSQSLDISLEYIIGIGGDSQSLRLPAETVVLTARKFPHLFLRRTADAPEVVETKTQTVGSTVSSTLQWKFNYQLTDNNQVASADKIDLTGLSTTCAPAVASSPWIEPSRRVQLSPDAAGKSLDVILELQWNGDYSATAAPSGFSSCKLSGELVFTLNGGQSVTVELQPLQFQYPIRK